ncbi:MAG: glycoside hydrolase family 88 protein [Planctomycetaceae bacterium]|nr:glycoside hydrolase family 88 protein [Planctomycetaceae bacterium]
MFVDRLIQAAVVVAALAAVSSFAAEPDPDGYRTVAIGVTRTGRPMTALVPIGDSLETKRPRVLFVSGLVGDDGAPHRLGDTFTNFDAAWCFPNPDAVGTKKLGTNFSGGNPAIGYPPRDKFYDSPTDPERRYVWRFIQMHAPDLVVEVVYGPGETWRRPRNARPLEFLKRLPKTTSPEVPDGTLVAAAESAAVPAIRVTTDNLAYLGRLDQAIDEASLPISENRKRKLKLLERTPEKVAEDLLRAYGTKLPAVQYIPALALVGRMRHEQHLQGPRSGIPVIVQKAIAPYVSGKGQAVTEKSGGSVFAGHLIFAELADRTAQLGRPSSRYVQLIKSVGDLAFDKTGEPLEVMPSHNEMSDAVFMAGPILAYAGKLTGDAKYFEASVRNMKFMQKLCLRDDGIYRHSPLDEAAWGRGNGFPALGLTWTLDALPESYAGRAEVAASLEKHLRALLTHQEYTGMWHQVIDKPESYAELTATSMIAYAMARGVRQGRLDAATFDGPIRQAWSALKTRIGTENGDLVDVCTGTGKQPNLRAYYDRPANNGYDDRGGAMALMIATEMELYLKKPN